MTAPTPEQMRALADAPDVDHWSAAARDALNAAADQLEAVEANVIGRALYGRAWDEAHENGSPWAHIGDEQSATVAQVLDAILTAKTAPQTDCHERPGGYCDVHGFRHDTAPQEDRDE